MLCSRSHLRLTHRLSQLALLLHSPLPSWGLTYDVAPVVEAAPSGAPNDATRINADADAGAAIDAVMEELLCATEDASADAGPTADAHRYAYPYGQASGLCSCWAALVDVCPACLLQAAAELGCAPVFCLQPRLVATHKLATALLPPPPPQADVRCCTGRGSCAFGRAQRRNTHQRRGRRRRGHRRRD